MRHDLSSINTQKDLLPILSALNAEMDAGNWTAINDWMMASESGATTLARIAALRCTSGIRRELDHWVMYRNNAMKIMDPKLLHGLLPVS